MLHSWLHDKISEKADAQKTKAMQAIETLSQPLCQSIRLSSRKTTLSAGFYCCNLIFGSKTMSKDDCNSNMANLYYGDKAMRKKGVINMLVDGDSPFNDLYEEDESNNGVKLYLKPWLCGSHSVSLQTLYTLHHKIYF